MIRWITDTVATAPWDAVPEAGPDYRLDVRDLVDKAGNLESTVRAKLDEALSVLATGRRVVVCCDYGMSRSNAVAAGIISRRMQVPLGEAIEVVRRATDASAIRLEVLSVVERVLEEKMTTAEEAGVRRVVVTGASGFVGTRVVPLLRDAGLEVIAPHREELDLERDVVPLHVSLRRHQPTTLVHLANPRAYSTNRGVGDSLTLLKNVLDAASESRIHLIYLSSWEVYSGHRERALAASEDTPARPGSTYGQAKWLSEALLNHYREDLGLQAAILRSSPAYGVEGEKPKFIWNFLRKALRNDDILAHRYRNGPPHLDLLHIDDLAAAIAAATVRNVSVDVNIGTGISTSTTEVAERLVAIVGSTSRVRHIQIEGDAPNIVMDTQRAKSVLGWVPRIDLETGLRGLVDATRGKNTERTGSGGGGR